MVCNGKQSQHSADTFHPIYKTRAEHPFLYYQQRSLTSLMKGLLRMFHCIAEAQESAFFYIVCCNVIIFAVAL